MPNPYHDAEGKFSTKNEMKAAYEDLATKGDLEGYFKLRTEYEAISKEMAPFEVKATPVSSKPSLPPIVTSLNPLSEPPRNADLRYVIDYEYDNYAEPAGRESDYGRNRVYSGLRIETVPPVRTILASIFNAHESDIPDDLVDYATNVLEMDDEDAYEIGASGGYYGEEVYINSTQIPALRAWYYKADNANDANGVLEYVRSKGVDTSGKTPVEALKAQLALENKGKLPAAVANANSIEVKSLRASNIIIPDKAKFDNTVASELPKASKSSNGSARDAVFTAVVAKDKNDKYVLVDGYSRVKGLPPGRATNYIVLSRSWAGSY